MLSSLLTTKKVLPCEENLQLNVKSINVYHQNFELMIKDLSYYIKHKYRVVLLTASTTRAKRLHELFEENELPSYLIKEFDSELLVGKIAIAFGNIHKGFEYPDIRFAVMAETDLVGTKHVSKKRKFDKGKKIDHFTELKVGDYIVHEHHGVGVFQGIETIDIDQISKDFIKISYRDNGNLYISTNQLNAIQKYIGAEGKAPKLNKLGTAEWKKTKAKVRGAVEELATDLIELYAKREQTNGYVYSSDTLWQQEFEELFPYDETDDQLNAIDDTKKDMESTKIMDRLICGDVGYGKTEVAIRAAFKAVQDGKQVAYLVPTTILAQQHYNNFVQRMKDFPIRVDMMSRFRTKKEQSVTIDALERGTVDIVIGTHRLVSKDVVFKDLGLLIIDEEQRFGVAHKEKIKQLKEDIDVLTLTATPIPRTLHMSMIGIRDMSILEEPPEERQPIQTYVLEHNDELIKDAIHREIARQGQVYYVYNRVKDIDEVALKIGAMVPEAVVDFAHGQMSERELEDKMIDFINGDIDVLVSTTIIETGLDIQNVNTIIIQDADHMGLSQLYQLRGRVGRSSRLAYAYLTYKRDKILQEVAEKRLKAIKEFTEFGSGFRIAMRDLEIRGAGNILGQSQHGHMDAVGYELYCKLLEEAVKHKKGFKPGDVFETTIDISINAYIPPTYIQDEVQKISSYKKIASIRDLKDLEDMQDELIDRYGELPNPVLNLLEVAYIKSYANSLSIISIEEKNHNILLEIKKDADIDPSKIPALILKDTKHRRFTINEKPYFTLILDKSERPKVLDYIKSLLQDINELKSS
jgi:transcription-repair coupling factor (superfamily II helicase)